MPSAPFASADPSPEGPRPPPSRWHAPRVEGLVPLPSFLLARLGAGGALDPARVARLRAALHEGDPLADALVAHLQEASPTDRVARRALVDRAIDEGLATATRHLGDEVPAEVRAFFEDVERDPPWLDRAAVARGAAVVLRLGRKAGWSLGAVSLLSGYLASGTVKPLVATGFLEARARRRLAETLEFVRAVATSGEGAPGSDAWRATLRVRLLHAAIRRGLSRAPSWREDAWGVPINQSDMVGTILQFSVAFVGGLAALGHVLGARDREDVMHLWRWEATLLGVAPDLVPVSFADAVATTRILNATEEGPDDDGRRLARALVAAWSEPRPAAAGEGLALRALARVEGRVLTGLARAVVGPRAADALGLPRDLYRFAPMLLAPVGLLEELATRASPRLRRAAERAGRARLEADAALALAQDDGAGHAPAYAAPAAFRPAVPLTEPHATLDSGVTPVLARPPRSSVLARLAFVLAFAFVTLLAGRAVASELVGPPPGDTPRVSHASPVQIPPLPPGFETRDLGWLKLSYRASARERVAPALAEADAFKAELAGLLGQPVLAGVEVRIVADADEMRALAPAVAPPPAYASGVAYPALRLVLVSLLAPRGAEAVDIPEVLRHELAHVALEEAVGFRHVPRWFNEGFAVVASREGKAARMQTLWNATLAGTLLPLQDIDRSFPDEPSKVNVAYAQGADFVRYLSRSADGARFASLFRRIEGGQAFEAAVSDAYGKDLRRLEFEWRGDLERRFTLWPALTGGGLVWMVGLGAFVGAWVKRRKRSKRILAQWAVDEAREDAWLAELRARALAERGEDAPAYLAPGAVPSSRPAPSKVHHEGGWYTLH